MSRKIIYEICFHGICDTTEKYFVIVEAGLFENETITMQTIMDAVKKSNQTERIVDKLMSDRFLRNGECVIFQRLEGGRDFIVGYDDKDFPITDMNDVIFDDLHVARFCGTTKTFLNITSVHSLGRDVSNSQQFGLKTLKN